MITRDNYEEFFLLYVDNELSAPDRQVVENFVADNPDLKEEWSALLECRLDPGDSLVFRDKASLLKHSLTATDDSGKEIILTEQNYEGWFLNYIDHELNPAARKAVEDFAALHPRFSRELGSLQRTVSTPDPAIIFAHKETLYKKSAPRAVIFLPWMRVAAAAVVLGAIGLYFFTTSNKGHQGPAVAVQVDKKTGATAVAPAIATSATGAGAAKTGGGPAGTNAIGSAGSKNASAAMASANTAVSGAASNAATSTNATALVNTTAPTVTTTRNGTASVDATTSARSTMAETGVAPGRKGKKERGTVTPGPADALYSSKGTTADQHQTKVSPDQVASTGHPDPKRGQPAGERSGFKGVGRSEGIEGAEIADEPGPARVHTGVTTQLAGTVHTVSTGPRLTANTTLVSQAVLSSQTTDNTEDDLLTQSASSKKTKLRGLFRKVSRVFEKTTSAADGDDKHKVFIGGFSFALK